MNINLDTLVEMVEKQLTLPEQGSPQSIYKTAAKLRINKALLLLITKRNILEKQKLSTLLFLK